MTHAYFFLKFLPRSLHIQKTSLIQWNNLHIQKIIPHSPLRKKNSTLIAPKLESKRRIDHIVHHWLGRELLQLQKFQHATFELHIF